MNAIPLIDVSEPRWLTELRRQCMATSQRKVAAELGVSTAMISQALKDKYPGDISKLERAVRGAYLGDTVSCPVLGELETNKCLRYQREKLSAVNPMRVQLFRACNGFCENSEKNREK
ncbi:MAG: transcriptional regulator [Thalassobium sp.]|nr:MAG: transcriptional regulator [Thalassobium sp.]